MVHEVSELPILLSREDKGTNWVRTGDFSTQQDAAQARKHQSISSDVLHTANDQESSTNDESCRGLGGVTPFGIRGGGFVVVVDTGQPTTRIAGDVVGHRSG